MPATRSKVIGGSARRTGAEVPAVPSRELEDTAPLDALVEEEFRVGAMGLAWDGDSERVVVEVGGLALQAQQLAAERERY